MPRNQTNGQSMTGPLKTESARQRWELFHQAIARAKESNVAALEESESGSNDSDHRPTLSIVR